MKFLLTSLFAFSLLIFSGKLNCMPPKSQCTKTVSNDKYIGKTTTINCKERNGCTTEKTIFKGGDSLTMQFCPPAKRK